MASNEKEIRSSVKQLLKDFTIIDEFTGGPMKTRCDLLAINKSQIIMIEIKSDKDTLDRLLNQVNDYLKYSNTVWVILDDKHKSSYFDKIHPHVPYKVHVTFYSDLKLPKFHHKNIEIESMKNLLWGEETKQLISFLKGKSKLSVSNKPKISDAIDYIYTIHELRIAIHEILYTRIVRLNESMCNGNKRFSKNFTGGVLESEISDKTLKQKLFDEFLLHH